MAQNDEQKRRGAPPGNRRAWKHGKRSGQAECRRRETRAVLKLAEHILVACRAMPDRLRPRPIRADQLILLSSRHPDGLAVAAAVGVDLATVAPPPRQTRRDSATSA